MTGRVCLFVGLIGLTLAGPVGTLAMNSEEKLLFANGLYRRGLYELAIPEYQMLMTNEASRAMHDLAAFRLGECFRNLDRRDEAATSYEFVVDQFPGSSYRQRAAFRRAEMDWEDGRLKDGAARFEQVLAMNPPEDIESASLYYSGLCMAGIDRMDDAEKNWRRLLKQHKKSPHADYARLALAGLLERRKAGKKEAATLFEEVMKDPETPALGAEATARAGLLAYQERDMKSASRYFSELGEQYKENEWNDRIRLEAAWAYLLDGQTDRSRDTARVGLTSAPKKDRPSWLYLMANVERRSNRFDEAKKYYDELLTDSPKHELAAAAAFEACGMAYQQSDYARVLELVPLAAADRAKDLSLLAMKAGALKELDRTDEAASVYQQIIHEHPDSDRASAAAYQLALFTGEKGDYKAAAMEFEAIATRYSESSVAADALMAAASMHQRIKRPAEAIESWKRLADRFPEYAMMDEGLMGQARAEVELNRDKDAENTLHSLITDHPESQHLPEAHYLRGTLYEKKEHYEEAEFHYLRAIALKPAPSLVRQIQHRRVAVLQRQGRNEDAANLMNKLLSGGDSGELPSPLLEWLARWNLENDRAAAAEKAARKLAESGETEGWRQVGFHLAGIAALEQDKPEKALDSFRKAASFELNTRETADAYFQMGEICLEQKNPSDAVEFFSRAAERASSDSVMDIRARSYLKLGLSHEAMENWSEAGRYYLSGGVLFDDPVLTPESLYRAAGALHAQLKKAERDRVVEELRERFPESEWRIRAEERWPAIAPAQ